MSFGERLASPTPRTRASQSVSATSLTLLVGLAVLTSFFPARSRAQSFRSTSEAPVAWTTFARTIQTQSQSVLGGDDEVARRLQATLEKLRIADPDQPPLSRIVRVWLKADGRVERVAFAPLSDAADADLRTLLTRVTAGATPAGMLQPVHLKLSLEVRR